MIFELSIFQLNSFIESRGIEVSLPKYLIIATAILSAILLNLNRLNS